MLNDKHIDQWAGYLIEELPEGLILERTLPKDIWGIFVEMYKKGYEDCLYDNNLAPSQIAAQKALDKFMQNTKNFPESESINE